ncbi:ParB/RepB/Spo0J family partition protein [Halodurantibacterium flavum]|uniref:ParB/RepB/Spo0J family partition protein n=1 Tax=Halodurantibacterium flavum TaxID=1382802 RepID=A0ABW4S9U8_9RHOB
MSRAVLIHTITELPLDAIDVTDDRLRPVSDVDVEGIAVSIAEHGLIYPLAVRRLPKQRFELIDGGHRLAALKRLGVSTAPVRCYEGPVAAIRLIEIDTNLARADLSDLDRAIHMAARKREFVAEHPETAQGKAGAVARWNATAEMAVASFVTATAERTGLPERKIRKFVEAGSALDKVTAERLRSAPKRIFLNDILALAKAEPARRSEAVEAFASGAVPKISKALKKSAVAPVKDPVDEQLKVLLSAWSRAGAAARRRFTEERYADLAPLVSDASAKHGDTIVYFQPPLPMGDRGVA